MSSSIAPLLIGRFLTGLCVGLLGPPCSVYIGETSGPRYRGFLLAAVSLAIALGILLAHIMGTFLHWRLTAAICSAFPFVCYLMMSIAPESPSWLVSHGYPLQAERSFRWLRGCDDESLLELQTLLQTHSVKSNTNKWQHAKKASFLKPLIIICIFFLTCQFSGVNAVAFYSVTIIRDALGPSINEYLAMGIVDVVRVVMSVVACILLRRFGRRPLAVISGIGTSFSLLVLAAYLYLTRNNGGAAWIPMLSLISYICFISVGIVPLPWAMTGEVFPTALRGLGSGIASALAFLAFFVVVKTGPAMFLNIGQDGTFLTYGTIALLGTIVLYFFLPETKDKTLQEIEDYFVHSKDKEKQEDTNV
ncbi:facilitated trehalose transporter Tret1-2 homolog [Ctenocephalides felis]|nr:facilitated trehalose transporter Tret1-2 homolog [Ctenocephalides felis]